jgi:teichoic acid transport system permease protein
MSATVPGASPTYVYDADVHGRPPLVPYVKELWRRREFLWEHARSTLHSQHFDTTLGQLWLILNPVLLGTVYFVLVDIIAGGSKGPEYFAHLLGCLFAFYYVANSMSAGANSVTSSRGLILNTYFPRALLPTSAVIQAFMRFWPTLTVYAVFHLIAGLPIGWNLLGIIPIVGILTLFAFGLALFFAALQVLFRDTASFLSYIVRLWLYLSPVLWLPDEPQGALAKVVALNPLFPILAEWSDVLTLGEAVDPVLLAWGFSWAVAAVFLGGWLFLAKEREFAVRL